jgi:hypothetical protein
MTAISRGRLNDGPVRTKFPEIEINEDGLTTLIEEWHCPTSELLSSIPEIYSLHRDFKDLECRIIRPVYLNDNYSKWIAIYQGVAGSSAGSLPADIWSSSNSTSQEPIETHPNFLTFGTPANGAIFDGDVFVGFGKNAPEQLRGVTSFLAPSVSISRISYSQGAPGGSSSLGKIDSPGGPLASSLTSGSQNWLKTQHDIEQYSDIWQLKETWLRSGNKGWSGGLYGT